MQTITFTSDISETVRHAQNGDKTAFEQIVRQYQGLVSGVLYSVTGDFHRSEDLAQETFLIAWHKLPELHEEENLAAWLCTIARNLAYRSFRNDKLSTSELVEEKASREPQPDFELQRQEQSELVWAALEKIPQPYRETLVLYYRSDQSIRSIAEATQSTEAAVKQKLYRARESLRSKIEEMIGDVLHNTAPGDVFTFGVMTAITGALVSTTAQTVAAATGTAAATGSGAAGATTGKATALAAIGSIVWPIMLYLWCISGFFVGQWVQVHNVPTLNARRFRIYSFYAWSRYFFVFVLGWGVFMSGVTMLFQRYGAIYGVSGRSPLLFFVPFMLVMLSVCVPLQMRFRKRFKQFVEADLGLTETKMPQYSYAQVVRCIQNAFFVNILILETGCGIALILPLTNGSGGVLFKLATLGISALIGLSFYGHYRFGFYLLESCRDETSLQKYPPLIEKPFEAVLGRCGTNPDLSNGLRAKNTPLWMRTWLWIGVIACAGWYASLLDWSVHPAETASCVVAWVLGMVFFHMLEKRCHKLSSRALVAALFAFLSGFFGAVLLGVQCGFSPENVWQKISGPGPGNMVYIVLLILFACSLTVGFANLSRWFSFKRPDKLRQLNEDDAKLEEAIAHWSEGGPPASGTYELAGEAPTLHAGETPALPGIRILVGYGVLILVIFSLAFAFRDQLFGQTVRRMHYVRTRNYTELIKLEPNNPVFYYERGCREENPAKAIEDFDTAIRLNSNYVEAYIQRANARLSGTEDFSEVTEALRERFLQVVADCDDAIRLEPENDEAWLARSTAHIYLNDFEAAIADANKAIEVAPHKSHNYHRRAMVYEDFDKLQEALADCNEAIRLHESFIRRYAGLPRETRDGINEEAKPFYWYRGKIYKKLGEHNKAKDDFEKAK